MKIVWFSEIKWTYLKTRKQQIIENFPPDWEVLFIESFVLGKNNQFLPVRQGRITYATVPFFKATPYPLINKLQALLPFRLLIEWVASLWVLWLCKKTGFNSPERVFATSNIYYANIIRRMKKRGVVYDCNDYPLGFSVLLGHAERMFRETIKISDAVTTVSQKLAEDIKNRHPKRVDVIGNGVDFHLFQKISTGKPAEMPSDSPIVFFSGAIAEWLNTELLERLMQSYTQTSFVILGPIKHPPTGLALLELNKKYGLVLIPEKKHHELPDYMNKAHVCILPFRMNRRILGANPNTLYEFLACGKPVVTFGFSDEVRNLAPDVFIVDSEEEFVEKVGIALQNGGHKEKLLAIAKNNSWKQKSESMASIIQSIV